MSPRVSVERWGERPAWQVRVDGTLVGVVYRQGRAFRAVREGSSTPETSSFTSRDAAAKALARIAGHRELGADVFDDERKRGRPPR